MSFLEPSLYGDGVTTVSVGASAPTCLAGTTGVTFLAPFLFLPVRTAFRLAIAHSAGSKTSAAFCSTENIAPVSSAAIAASLASSRVLVAVVACACSSSVLLASISLKLACASKAAKYGARPSSTLSPDSKSIVAGSAKKSSTVCSLVSYMSFSLLHVTNAAPNSVSGFAIFARCVCSTSASCSLFHSASSGNVSLCL